MATVDELIVKAKPEGIDSTTEQLGRMDEQFEETSESMDEQAGIFQQLANSMTGMMGAVVAGVTVAIGGLLTQVPILGDVMSGFIAVVRAVAYQLDKRLRPSLNPVVSGLYELSNAIFEGDWEKAKGIIKDFADAIGDINIGKAIGNIIGSIKDILKDLNLLSVFKGMWNGVKQFLFKDIPKFVSNLAERIDWMGIFEAVVETLSDAGERLTTGLIELMRAVNWSRVGNIAMGMFVTFLKRSLIKQAASQLAIARLLIDLIGKGMKKLWNVAKGWGKGIIDSIVEGIKSRLPSLESLLAGVPGVDWAIDQVNDIAGETGGNRGVTMAGLGGTPQSTGGGNIFLDGQLINENQSRYGQSTVTRNGGR